MSATGDLVTGQGAVSNFHWLYAHATLVRLFTSATDGRNQFWSQIPGIQSVLSRAQIQADPLPQVDLILDHHLLGFANGWVNVLGGTRPLGFPGHVLGTFGLPDPGQSFFPSYYWQLANICANDLSTVIAANDARPIVYTGHSLGGASSVVCAFLDGTRPTARNRMAVTFGSPKARYVQGMDGKDFMHYRVVNIFDIVPFMSFSLIPVHILLSPLKALGTSVFHYGQVVAFDPEGRLFPFDATSPFPLAPATFVVAAIHYGDPFQAHYMDGYAWLLRRYLANLSLPLDPFWDIVNDYCNKAEGMEWNIPGFPAQSAPALPSGFIPPSPVLVEELLLQTGGDAAQLVTASVLDPPEGLVVQTGQSLAATLAAVSGRGFTDVELRLSKAAVPDPNNILIGNMIEADYPGYQPRGGAIWATTAPPPNSVGQLYAARVGYFSSGDDFTQTVHHLYMTAKEAGNPDLVLLAVVPLEGGVLLNRPGQNLVFDVEVCPSSA
jgi:pimeloyl-ACP methyl ester carboxylesterase